MKTLTQRWTYARAAAKLPTELRVEIVGETLHEMTAPSTAHQDIVTELTVRLRQFAQAHQLGKVLCAPVDVIFDEAHVVQPDVAFLQQQRRAVLSSRGFEGAPDLVVEVISPSSLYRDYHLKKTLYERFGVAGYWIVDPAHRAVEVFALRDGAYDLHALAAEAGTVTSAVLPGFSLEVAEFFEVLDA